MKKDATQVGSSPYTTRRIVSPYTNISITNSSTEDRRRVATPSEEEGRWIKQGGLRQEQQKGSMPGKLGGKISRSAVSNQGVWRSPLIQHNLDSKAMDFESACPERAF